VVYPDFFAPKTNEVWDDLLVYLSTDFHYDGIWLDMNEIANFCDGECKESNSLSFFGTLTYISKELNRANNE